MLTLHIPIPIFVVVIIIGWLAIGLITAIIANIKGLIHIFLEMLFDTIMGPIVAWTLFGEWRKKRKEKKKKKRPPAVQAKADYSEH